jgi:superfamily II DNA or RNA helicase
MPLALKDWQTEAIDAWKGCYYKGMVEAVTGSGKSYLALGAIEQPPC